MNKKNFKKAGVGLLVSALFVGGAYAFLKNTETATKTNTIVPGTIRVIFDNQASVVSLTGNDAIPMTADYAYNTLTPYTFTINNTGSIDANYTIKAIAEDGNTISNDLILVSIDSKMSAYWFQIDGFYNTLEEAEQSAENEKVRRGTDQIKAVLTSDWNTHVPENFQSKYTVLMYGNLVTHPEYGYYDTIEEANNKRDELRAENPSIVYGGSMNVNTAEGTKYVVVTEEPGEKMRGTWKKLSDITLTSDVGIVSGNEHSYTMYVRIDENATNGDVLGKTASFHLELEAIQNNDAVDNRAYYKHVGLGLVIDNATYNTLDDSVKKFYPVYTGDIYRYTNDEYNLNEMLGDNTTSYVGYTLSDGSKVANKVEYGVGQTYPGSTETIVSVDSYNIPTTKTQIR